MHMVVVLPMREEGVEIRPEALSDNVADVEGPRTFRRAEDKNVEEVLSEVKVADVSRNASVAVGYTQEQEG